MEFYPYYYKVDIFKNIYLVSIFDTSNIDIRIHAANDTSILYEIYKDNIYYNYSKYAMGMYKKINANEE